MARRRAVDDDDDIDLPTDSVWQCRERWDNDATAAAVRDILASFDGEPEVDTQVFRTMQRWIDRTDRLGIGDGRGRSILALRIFLEGENGDALFEPIFSAVGWVVFELQHHGMAMLDAIDTIKLTDLLATMRGLNLFKESSLERYLSIAIRNKLLDILNPPVERPAYLVERAYVAQRRLAFNERNMDLGRQMLKSRAKGDREYGSRRLDTNTAAALMAIAKKFGDKPQIYRNLSWRALTELSKVTVMKRRNIEAQIIAGQRLSAAVIRNTLDTLPVFKPGYTRQATTKGSGKIRTLEPAA